VPARPAGVHVRYPTWPAARQAGGAAGGPSPRKMGSPAYVRVVAEVTLLAKVRVFADVPV
jgi:hypothetical protein